MSKHYLQEKITGTQGQVVGFDANGNAIPQAPPASGFTKEETLKAATAALYGLGASAVPDDVLAWLGKYAEYWWKRRTVTQGYIDKKTNISANVRVGSSGTTNVTFKYSSSVNVTETEITLNNPTSATMNYTGIPALAPCYISFEYQSHSTIYYLPAGTTAGNSSSTIYQPSSLGQPYVSLSGSGSPRAKTLTIEAAEIKGEWEYVYSTNRNTYPDRGVVGGYEYEYRGVPFGELPNLITRIETGSYVGTGTYGSANPNSLTFGFAPKIVMLRDANGHFGFGTYEESTARYAMIADTLTTEFKSYQGFSTDFMSSGYGKKSADGLTFTWYHESSAVRQCNYATTEYRYLAIG